jgi:hypothetical protein
MGPITLATLRQIKSLAKTGYLPNKGPVCTEKPNPYITVLKPDKDRVTTRRYNRGASITILLAPAAVV